MSSVASRLLVIALAWATAAATSAQDGAPEAAPAPATADTPRDEGTSPDQRDAPSPDAEPSSLAMRAFQRIQIRGFVSEGGFISTDNDYIGTSDRGSLKFFEAGINFQAELVDGLRVGLQLVSRSVGNLSEEVPRLDWALLDYEWRSWLGLRAGLIKMPLGLYNESIAIDSARTPILLPESVYPLRNRDALVSHTGFALYGDIQLGPPGALEYQGWFGTLMVPRSALELDGARLDEVDAKFVGGAQLFWRPPIEGLRLGGTYLHAVLDFHLTLDPNVVDQVVMAGYAPAGYDGALVVSQDPASIWVASAEYVRGDLLLAFEYSRWLKRERSSLPEVLPPHREDAERFYLLMSYHLPRYVTLGTYFSVTHADVNDRDGSSLEEPVWGFQRDLAGTIRFDVNEFWLWKIEGHFMDGAADLQASLNPNPTRRWGLFLLRTTVTFW